MSRFVNPSKTSVYFQPYPGALPLRLIEQSIITAPNGKGFSFESDYGAGNYRGSRLTSNQNRVNFNIQSRREDLSELIRQLGDGKSLFNIIVLESDCNNAPDFGNFISGAIFFDCGLTGKGLSQDFSNGTTSGDPKQMNTLAVTAADWIDIRPPLSRLYTPAAFSGSALLTCIAYTPVASTPIGITELTFVGGSLAGNGILYFTYGKGSGVWYAAGVTGLPATLVVNGITIIGNRIVIATTKGVYNSDLGQLTTGNLTWYLSNGTLTTDNVTDITSPSSGVILASTTDANGQFLWSTDQGFSFTKVSNTFAGRQYNRVGGISDNLLWAGTLNQYLIRIINVNKYTGLSLLNPDGTILPASADILCVAVPPNRPNEVYIGVTDGRILRSRNAAAPRPVFEEILYNKTGNATQTVTDINFSPDGATMWVTQTDGLTNRYTGIDYSGGYAGSSMIFPPFGAIRGGLEIIVFSPQSAIAVDGQAYLVIYE